MCLIAFRWQPDSEAPLLVAANRDEFYARPAAPLDWWPGGRILAGRDLQAGGSWMGVTRDGRFAALTNYRDPREIKPGAPSRGALVAGFLAATTGAADYLAGLRPAAAYNGFNLLLYDGRELLGYESRADRVLRFEAGVHAVSNAAFDTPWPKVEALKAGLAARADDDAALFALLADPAIAPDERLPATGVPLEWERALSAAMIRTPDYGTRASTVLRLGRRTASMIELSYARGVPAGERSFRFELD